MEKENGIRYQRSSFRKPPRPNSAYMNPGFTFGGDESPPTLSCPSSPDKSEASLLEAKKHLMQKRTQLSDSKRPQSCYQWMNTRNITENNPQMKSQRDKNISGQLELLF